MIMVQYEFIEWTVSLSNRANVVDKFPIMWYNTGSQLSRGSVITVPREPLAKAAELHWGWVCLGRKLWVCLGRTLRNSTSAIEMRGCSRIVFQSCFPSSPRESREQAEEFHFWN